MNNRFINQLFKKYFASEISKNFTTLAFGTALSQAIPILLQFILRRQYTVETFGAYSIYLSFVGILVILSSLKYDNAIILPKNNSHAKYLLLLSLICIIYTNIIVFILIFLFKPFFIKALDIPQILIPYLYFIPISSFLFSSFQSINYWLIRNKKFKTSATGRITRRTTEGISQIIAGYTKHTGGLFIGDIIGLTAMNIYTWHTVIIKNIKKLNKIKITTLIHVAKRYSNFPKYNLIPALLNTTSLLLPTILINKIYNETITGYYDLSKTLLALPIALITTALSQVLFQHMSALKNNQQPIIKKTSKITKNLAILSLLGCTIILLLGENIFAMFGKQWAESGIYAKYLVFGYAIKFIVSPISPALMVLEKLKPLAIWQTFYFTAICSLLLFNNLSIYNFLTIYLIIDIIAYTSYYLLIVYHIKNYDNKI